MYRRMAVYVVIGIVLMPIGHVHAMGLEGLVGAESAQKLTVDGVIRRTELKDAQPTLVPATEFSRRLVADVRDELKPNILIEALYLLEKPQQARGRSWTEDERVSIYNKTRALSSLAGIQYYSASRKTMRTFYERSFVVASAGSKTPLPDPVVNSIPERSLLYARHKDLTFGDNVYQYEYRFSGDVLAFILKNESGMSYGMVPLLGKGNLRSVVVIMDTEDALLVYAASMVRSMMIPGVEGKIRSSFANRADAVFSWFSDQALSVLSNSTEKSR